MSSDHPEWGEDKIAEELAAKFSVYHSGSTIRRYMVRYRPPPRRQQTWRTFVRNHAKELWSCDFTTQYTVAFTVAYVFVVMEIASRRIVHVNVTAAPTLPWVQQQIREATSWGKTPRFLVHDNDGIYGQYGRRVTIEKKGAKRSHRYHLDLWLDETMGVLDHFLFRGVDHIRRVVVRYIEFYNRARPSQAIRGIPDPYPELRQPPPANGKLVALPCWPPCISVQSRHRALEGV